MKLTRKLEWYFDEMDSIARDDEPSERQTKIKTYRGKLSGVSTSATDFHIPPTVSGIVQAGVKGGSTIKNLYIPSSLTEIPPLSFGFFYSLQNIYVDEDNNAFVDIDGVLFTADRKKLVCFPRGRFGDKYVVPEGTEIIGENAFQGTVTTEVVMPSTLKKIEPDAFTESFIYICNMSNTDHNELGARCFKNSWSDSAHPVYVVRKRKIALEDVYTSRGNWGYKRCVFCSPNQLDEIYEEIFIGSFDESEVFGKTAREARRQKRLLEEKENREAEEEFKKRRQREEELFNKDTVKFGSYPQSADRTVAPIEWCVLCKDDKKALLISKYCIDAVRFHNKPVGVTWEHCSLRKWLNETFFNSAFTETEQKRIMGTRVKAVRNGYLDHSADPGNDTADKIFILDIQEANEYFGPFRSGETSYTPYAQTKDTRAHNYSNCPWLSRTPHEKQTEVETVYSKEDDEDFRRAWSAVNIDRVKGLRPVMWLNLDENSENINLPEYEFAIKEAFERKQKNDPGIIEFGRYPTSVDGKKTPIKWQILEKEGDRAFVISKYVIEKKRYNECGKDVKVWDCEGTTWEECTLRSWLNDEFIHEAFNEEERQRIETTFLINDKIRGTKSKSGNNTTDKVFILSVSEVEKYFDTEKARKCQATDYVQDPECDYFESFSYDGNFHIDPSGRFETTDGIKGTCGWILRTPGAEQNRCAKVLSNGDITKFGWTSYEEGIRPAMWIKLDD